MTTNSRRGLFFTSLFLVLGVAVALTGPAGAGTQAQPKKAALVIQHHVRGCHLWSLNGGKLIVDQKLHLARGGFLTLTNNDLMAQELVQTKGPKVLQKLLKPFGKSQVMPGESMGGAAGPYALTHSGARVKVTFPKAGVYRFAVKDRGDYTEVKTIGEDHSLTLTVNVS
jgi:hypothetical protein